ncbi:MAG: rod shape-determining protein RodA [Candidatus Omnitrophica bacterium]|nr:rod shape-determining protein RodA [Candidatus Omnitrophota bacterium]
MAAREVTLPREPQEKYLKRLKSWGFWALKGEGMLKEVRGQVDHVLLFAVLAIITIGIVFIYSATWDPVSSVGLRTLVIKQMIWVAGGLLLVFLITNIDYMRLVNYAYLAYVINLLALVFLLFFGGERYGARRWIDLGPLSIQPSEFMKVTVIMVLAAFLGERRENAGSFGNFAGSIVLIFPAAVLIFLQPDLGTAFVLVPILFTMLFICGENVKYIVSSIILGLASLPFFWLLLKDYQKDRLMVFINPDIDPLGAGYTIIQSKIAIGSGGLFGKGWLNGTQSHLKFLPERHTDFIFSVVGEEWGFAGAVLLVGLYAVVIARGIRIIAGSADIYARALAAGVVTLLAFQVFVNISMTIGMMPVVGLPLPFVSYGGSNTVASLICVGFLLSISRRAS